MSKEHEENSEENGFLEGSSKAPGKRPTALGCLFRVWGLRNLKKIKKKKKGGGGKTKKAKFNVKMGDGWKKGAPSPPPPELRHRKGD